ncbi:unnamed protein product [Ilex paraguariensis]|uniref:Uncharacterized protein n=1 Tax=Ilex paraguariensis TaxID=185542 RepID=A0ABC8RQS9_9AQUA
MHEDGASTARGAEEASATGGAEEKGMEVPWVSFIARPSNLRGEAARVMRPGAHASEARVEDHLGEPVVCAQGLGARGAFGEVPQAIGTGEMSLVVLGSMSDPPLPLGEASLQLSEPPLTRGSSVSIGKLPLALGEAPLQLGEPPLVPGPSVESVICYGQSTRRPTGQGLVSTEVVSLVNGSERA